MNVVPCDPRAGYRVRESEIDEAVRRVLDSGRYILGPEVEAFENEFAAYLGVTHAVGVASGTDGLSIALRALDIGPGDLVATVSHTAVATAAGIELTGAMPILVDVDPDSFTMDAESLETALRTCAADCRLAGRVKAVIPVHLYGLSANMSSICQLARDHGLRLIEDCSQSHGAVVNGQRTGTFGDVGVFSLYPTKNLAAFGDAGIVTTNDAALADRLRLVREYGWRQRNHSELRGMNSRLDELQAAILRVRLRYLDVDNAARRVIAETYSLELAGSGLVCPQEPPNSRSVFHQYVVRARERDRLRERLRQAGVQTLIHYPEAVHQQPAYRGRLPQVVPLVRTEETVRQILSLPMYPELPLETARFVATTAARLALEDS